jgi:serine/threonine-protein kinase
MSPEQMHSASSVDPRTDIWALGVVLYEALAGVPPFRGDTLPEVCAKILTSTPVTLSRVRGDIPADLDGVVQKCLEKDRERRFHDIAEMAAALVPFGSESARMSMRRISGVLHGTSCAEPQARPAAPVGTVSHEATLAAPPETYRAQGAEPRPTGTPLAGTGRPVASTLGDRPARPSRTVAWAGIGILGVVGAATAWMARGARTASDGASPSAIATTQAPPEATAIGIGTASSASADSSSAFPDPVVPVSTATLVFVAGAASTSGHATGTPGAAQPRPRPRTDTAPKVAPRVSPSVATPGPPSSSAQRPEVAPSAPTANCRLVSSFDAKGREHFIQVCDGN